LAAAFNLPISITKSAHVHMTHYKESSTIALDYSTPLIS